MTAKVYIVALLVSLAVNAVVTLGVHFVLPQFGYAQEYVATYVVAYAITMFARMRRG